jgi:hypothetical protein
MTRLGLRRSVVVFVIALAVRAIYAAIFLRHYTPISDTASYLEIARNVAHGHGFSAVFPYFARHETAFRPPLYPLLLGGVFTITGVHVLVAQIVNIILGSLGVLLLAVLATRIAARPQAGVITGVLAATFPPLVFNDVVPLTEALSVVLLASALILLVQQQYLLAGVLTGLLVLTRTSAQLFIPIVAIWVISRFGLRAALSFCVASVLVVAPWLVRNRLVFHKTVLVTSNGFNIAAIWSDEAQRIGYFVDPALNPAFASVRHYGPGADATNFNEANLDAAFRKVGLQGVRDHPGHIPYQLVKNVAYLTDINWRTSDSPESLDGRNLTLRHIVLPVIWIGELTWLAALFAVRRRPGGGLLFAAAAYFFIVALIAVSPPRLRAPTDALGTVAAGVAIASSPRWQRGLKVRRRAPGGADRETRLISTPSG